jgi:hypothetical protein
VYTPIEVEKVNKIRVKLLFCSVASFASAIGLYALFRNPFSFVIFEWFDSPIISYNPVITLQKDSNVILSIVAYNIPDGLWFLSGIFSIWSVWLNDAKWCIRYTIGFCIMAVLFEIIQLKDTIHGTFDVLDLVIIIIMAVLSGIGYTYSIFRRKNYD